VAIGDQRYYASLNGQGVIAVDETGFRFGAMIARPASMQPPVTKEGINRGFQGPTMSPQAGALTGLRESQGIVTVDKAVMTSKDVLIQVQEWVGRVRKTVDEPVQFRPASSVLERPQAPFVMPQPQPEQVIEDPQPEVDGKPRRGQTGQEEGRRP
jgi:hypothetical protein